MWWVQHAQSNLRTHDTPQHHNPIQQAAHSRCPESAMSTADPYLKYNTYGALGCMRMSATQWVRHEHIHDKACANVQRSACDQNHHYTPFEYHWSTHGTTLAAHPTDRQLTPRDPAAYHAEPQALVGVHVRPPVHQHFPQKNWLYMWQCHAALLSPTAAAPRPCQQSLLAVQLVSSPPDMLNEGVAHCCMWTDIFNNHLSRVPSRWPHHAWCCVMYPAPSPVVDRKSQSHTTPLPQHPVQAAPAILQTASTHTDSWLCMNYSCPGYGKASIDVMNAILAALSFSYCGSNNNAMTCCRNSGGTSDCRSCRCLSACSRADQPISSAIPRSAGTLASCTPTSHTGCGSDGPPVAWGTVDGARLEPALPLLWDLADARPSPVAAAAATVTTVPVVSGWSAPVRGRTCRTGPDELFVGRTLLVDGPPARSGWVEAGGAGWDARTLTAPANGMAEGSGARRGSCPPREKPAALLEVLGAAVSTLADPCTAASAAIWAATAVACCRLCASFFCTLSHQCQCQCQVFVNATVHAVQSLSVALIGHQQLVPSAWLVATRTTDTIERHKWWCKNVKLQIRSPGHIAIHSILLDSCFMQSLPVGRPLVHKATWASACARAHLCM